MRLSSWLAPLALLVACTDAAPAPSAPALARSAGPGEGAEARRRAHLDLRAEREALLAAERAHAAASAGGLLGGFTGALAEDVVFLYPGAPILQGRAAAVAFLAALPGAAAQTLTWAPAHVDVSSDATRGYTYGHGERVVGGVTSHFQYVSYWRRDAGGAWRVAFWLLRNALATAPRTVPALCASPGHKHYRHFPKATEAGTEAALLRVDAEFSALSGRAGGAEAFGAYVADNGALLLGSGYACGREEMRAANASLAPGALTWVPALADAAPSGDLGATVGIGAFRAGEQTFYSKYLTIWKRQPNGAWRFVVDAGNATPAP